MDRGTASPAEIFDGGYLVDRQVRDVLDVEVAEDVVRRVEDKVAAARAEVASFFGLALSRSEGAGFLRYHAGGLYRRHRDRALTDLEIDARLVSLVVFLNSASDEPRGDGFQGGALRLYPGAAEDPLDVRPQTGLLIAFPADMPHEALPVVRGVRDVVVDWYY